MFCVFFEVEPRDGQADTYFRLAMGMREQVQRIDGFLDVERFANPERENAFLSFSTWRDEKALIRWRTLDKHQVMQARGRREIFADYRIRIGELTADSALDGPPVQHRFDTTEAGAARSLLFEDFSSDVRDPGAPADCLSSLLFRSVLTPERSARLSGWEAESGAANAAAARDGPARRRAFRVIRDYTMVERSEAPQYFPPVP